MRRKKHQRGSSLIEFALAFMIFFVTVYGIMEFGRIVGSYNILAGAVREGARYAIVHGSASGSEASQTDIQNVVRKWAIGLDSNSVQVTPTWNPTGKGPGSTVTLVATYTVMPFTRLIIKNGITLTSSSSMVVSQ